MNELIKVHILMKQSLPYVFTLKELNSDLLQQHSFHISTSKPLNNSFVHMTVCVCVYMHACTHMRWLG
jgi:hypothetical protein